MRPNTSESGIFSTNRNRPVNTSMLTRMLVPKPKNAFQSPGVHSRGLKPPTGSAGLELVMVGMARSPSHGTDTNSGGECVDHRLRRRHPAEYAALRLDHGEPGLVEL